MTTPLNLREYEALARERMAASAFDYYAGGADDEATLADNEASWRRMRLHPRVLVDVSAVDASTTILGAPLSMPVLTAPCALNLLAHSHGERGVARAAAAAGIIQVLSTASSTSLEDVAAAEPGGRRWFQLYCYRDREVTRDLVRRAEAAGYAALCVTVDLPVLGRREREIRSGFHAPPAIGLANLAPYAKDTVPAVAGQSGLAAYASARWDPSLSWRSIEWIRSITTLPVVLKGILTAADARLAVEHGCAAVVVSNHGGRQLDTCVSTCDALRAIADSLGGSTELLVDGGIRRGTDVVKAIALGARAVLIGRPYLWALATNGEAGVREALELLRAEIVMAMTLCGRVDVAQIDRAVLGE
jgi:4-hydroxymandelate oxidase